MAGADDAPQILGIEARRERRPVRAGLAVVEAVREIEAAEPLEVRIGVATGVVVVGDLVGEGVAQEQTVVGETPNLAARLQVLAEPGAVVIASATRRLIGSRFALHALGSHALKGLAGPVEARVVEGVAAPRAASTPGGACRLCRPRDRTRFAAGWAGI
jgi:class 3 adenylate cyclase